MINSRKPAWLFATMSLALALGTLTAVKATDSTTIKTFDCDDLKEVITKSGVTVDKAANKDDKGALKFSCDKSTVFRLYEVPVSEIDNAKLIYRAKVKTADVKGKAYLEMWCHFADKGEFFSRGLDQPLSGTNDWTTAETPFFLKQGEKPDRVKLNLVIDGGGTAWVSDVELARTAL